MCGVMHTVNIKTNPNMEAGIKGNASTCAVAHAQTHTPPALKCPNIAPLTPNTQLLLSVRTLEAPRGKESHLTLEMTTLVMAKVAVMSLEHDTQCSNVLSTVLRARGCRSSSTTSMHAPSYTSSNRHSDIFTGSLLDRHGCKHSEPADGCGLCQLVSHLTL